MLKVRENKRKGCQPYCTLSQRSLRAMRYLVSPSRSSHRRQKANVPKFWLITFSRCLDLANLQDKVCRISYIIITPQHIKKMFLHHLKLSHVKLKTWQELAISYIVLLTWLTGVEHVQRRSSSCSGMSPCHHGRSRGQWTQMSQWHILHSLPLSLPPHPSLWALFSLHESLENFVSRNVNAPDQVKLCTAVHLLILYK